MSGQPHLESHRTVFDNGLTLIVSENRRLPLIGLQVFVLAGVDQNPVGQSGLASLTTRLLDEGTEKYDHEQIARILENAGSSLSLFSQREVSGISVQFRSDELAAILDLLQQMLRYPTFPPARLQLELEVVLNHLRALQDEPQSVANQLLNRLVYAGTPLENPVLGLPEEVSALTVEEVRRFHAQKFAPGSVWISVAGDVDRKELSDQIGSLFADWQAPQFSRQVVTSFRRQDRPLRLEKQMDKEQVHILIGHLGVERRCSDHLALQLLDVILGSGPGFTSRIPRKLRDEQGLAYTTYSDIASSSGIYPGRFQAYISTSADNRERALEGLLNEIRQVVRDGVEEEELETAKRFLTGSFVFELQSNYLVSRFMFAIELFELGSNYLERYPKMIAAISRDDVNRVARLHLDTVNYSTVVVGPVEGVQSARGEGIDQDPGRGN